MLHQPNRSDEWGSNSSETPLVITTSTRNVVTVLSRDSTQMTNVSNDAVAGALEQILYTEGEFLRPMQVGAITAVIEHIRNGQRVGLIKKPTGVGKTVSFGLILRNLGIPSLVIVPRTNLIESTRGELIGSEVEKKEGIGVDPDGVYLIYPNKMTIGSVDNKTKNASESLRECLSQIGKSNRKDKLIIMTYASLISIKKNDPELWATLMAYVGVIISDEAHRSLGPMAQGAYADTAEFDKIVALIERYQKIHLVFTATPRLSNKDVRQIYPVIYHGTFMEAVRNDEIILPSRVTVDSLYQGRDGIYIDAQGNLGDELLIDKYIELKNTQPNRYFPAIFFCRNIQHAEEIRKNLEAKGIRTMRVTHHREDTHNNNPDEAKEAFYQNKIDAVTTVTRVGEGWDVPMLRCAIPLYPTSSPARAVQGLGRITRKLPHELEYLGGAKNHTNTIIIEPRDWIYHHASSLIGTTFFDAPPPRNEDDIIEKAFPFPHIIPGQTGDISSRAHTKAQIERIPPAAQAGKEQSIGNTRRPGVFEILYLLGEIDAEAMGEFFPEVNIASLERLELDKDGEIVINGVRYMYVGSRTMHYFRETIGPLRAHIASLSDEWKTENMIGFGARVSGQLVDIYRKDALLTLVQERYRDDKIVDPSKGYYRDTDGHTWFIGMGSLGSGMSLPVSSTWIHQKMKMYPEWGKKYIRPMVSIYKPDGKRVNVTLIDYSALWTLIAREYKKFSIADKLGVSQDFGGSHVAITEPSHSGRCFGLLEVFRLDSIHSFIELMSGITSYPLRKTPIRNKDGLEIPGTFYYTKKEVDKAFIELWEEIGDS